MIILPILQFACYCWLVIKHENVIIKLLLIN